MNTIDRIATLVLAMLLLAVLAFVTSLGGYYGTRAAAVLALISVFGAIALVAKFFPGK